MKKSIWMSVPLALALLSGCSGGSSSEPQNVASAQSVTGQFIDSAVSGLNYSCSSGGHGVTNTQGEFTCLSGDIVTFSINTYALGSALMGDIITPISLYPNDARASLNVAQLLQTLDSDGNTSNGISLDSTSQEVQALVTNVDVSFTQVDFDNAIVSYIGKTLLNEHVAQAHLDASLNKEDSSEVIETTPTSKSLVFILNGVTQAVCDTQDVTRGIYDGYSDYSAFTQAGGTAEYTYYAQHTSCDSYTSAGECRAQDLTSNVGGTGSCVLEIGFPNTQDTETQDAGEVTSKVLEYMTENEYTLALSDAQMSNIRGKYNISSFIVDLTTIADVYSSIDTQPRISDTLYSLDYTSKILSKISVELLGMNFEGENSLSMPDISHTVKVDSISEGSVDGFTGFAKYTLKDEYLDYGGGNQLKFSKALDSELLNTILETKSFTQGDEGQFIYDKSNASLSVKLYLNESAKQKVLVEIQKSLN